MTLALLILAPFIGSALAAALPGHARNTGAALGVIVSLAGLVQTALLYERVADGQALRATLTWLPAYGVDLVLRVDALAWVFLILIFAIGALVSIYARYYLSSADPVPRFYALLLAFMGAMVGVVTSGNLVQLVAFWELTSLVSFLLIGYWHHRADARRGARMALTVTAAGGLCLFAGVLVLGHIVGSYDLDAVLQAGDAIRTSPLYGAALVLISLGALTKSAQFPFHFWLPKAMAAPTPVSSYLHSATMVKAGVFLLARLWPALSGTDLWFWLIGGAGLATLLVGAVGALLQQDIKGVLAYSTISHLGLITLLLGLNSSLAAVAAVFHVINHATFKASLFMAAGIIDHEAGTRDLRRLGGLRHAMPITCTLAAVASAAMAGVPLLNGFLSKEMFFAETVYISGSRWLEFGLPAAATLAGTFSVAYSLRFVYGTFFGATATDLPRQPHEPPRWMRFPVELLVVVCVLVGVLPNLLVGPFLRSAALAMLGPATPEFDLAIWHGVNLPLMMSVVALICGVILYRVARPTLRRRVDGAGAWADGASLYHALLAAIGRTSAIVLRRLSASGLQGQLLWVIGVAIVFGIAPMFDDGWGFGPLPITPINPVFVVFWLVGMACALGAAWQAAYHRLAALTMLGGAGLVTCVTYVWFSAPDLALTQLMVETVTTVLMLLGLRWLPKPPLPAARPAGIAARVCWPVWWRRSRDALVALVAGSGIGVLTYAVLTRPYPASIASQYLERSVSEGGGANVVNVIIVDFRGFDTYGEIIVLGVVALTIFALLRRFRPAADSMDAREGKRADAADDLLLPAVMLRLMMPLAVVVAIYLFMRGHNQPRGGFVAGLVIAVAIIMQYMVSGSEWVEAHITLRPVRWIAFGMLVAVCTGLGVTWGGVPFLTSREAHVLLPVIGEIHVSSVLLLDLGVFALVVGSTVLVLIALAHQSRRRHRVATAAGPR